MISLLIKFAPWLASHLSVWLLMLWAAATLGDVCLRHVKFNSWLEKTIFRIALGLGLVSLLWFVLAISGVFYPRLIQMVTILIATYGIFRWRSNLFGREWLKGGRDWIRREYLHSPLKLFGLSALAVLVVAYEIHLVWLSLFPPIAWDSTLYHLPLARDYLNAHKLILRMGLPYPVVPALEHLLFSWGMALGDDLHAHLIGHTFFILTAAGLISFGIRQGRPAVGLTAAALWLAHPLVLLFQGTAYVDMGLTCYSFLAVYALKLFADEKKSEWWFLAITLAAMAASTKMPGLIFLAGIVAWSFWATWRNWLSRNQLLKGWALAALVLIPWFGFIAYHAGNPMWPMFPQLSKGWWNYSSLKVQDFGKSVGIPHTLWNFIRLPYELVVHPKKFFPDEHLSFLPVVIIWPLAWIVSLKDRSVRWWTGWILYFITAWFFSIQALRFLFPVLPMIGLAICESLEWIFNRILASPSKRLAIWAVVILCLALPTFVQLNKMIYARKFYPPITESERDVWLNDFRLSYPGVKFINAHASNEDTVFLNGGSFLPYHLRPRVLSIEYDFVWPQTAEWLAKVETEKPTWILLSHQGQTLSDDSPFERPTGNLYELVFASETAHVFRRTPLPATMASETLNLRSNECLPVAANNQPQPVYEGYLDEATCQTIRGWVWNTNLPNCSLKVDIYDNGQLLTTIPANLTRQDLLVAGKGNGRHGFTFRPPDQLNDGRQHSISVKVSGAPIELGNSPLTATCSQ
ncbi:MAG: glycosyltransferase family 39 protein [Acidobacteriota bacterium]|nr:glycosyltransferase family 39 protein [Acidobacteriota bacterium]